MFYYSIYVLEELDNSSLEVEYIRLRRNVEIRAPSSILFLKKGVSTWRFHSLVAQDYSFLGYDAVFIDCYVFVDVSGNLDGGSKLVPHVAH